jgi:hypothetical protein
MSWLLIPALITLTLTLSYEGDGRVRMKDIGEQPNQNPGG